jgi:hypothetical protein
MRVARFRVHGRFTPATAATITITCDGQRGTLAVRPLRRHEAVVVDLASIASLVLLRDAMAKAREKKLAKKRGRS